MGQADARVLYLARGDAMTAFFTDTETAMVLSRRKHADQPIGPGHREPVACEVDQTVVRMKFEKASQPRRVIGMEHGGCYGGV
jgi:hypothetical protein